QSGARRSSHQACASSLSFVTVIVWPGSRSASQHAMCSSDRKRFIVLQVKTMSLHHSRAGTRQWKSSDASSGRWSRISTTIGSPQSGEDDSVRPSTWSAAQMPIASHAQFAYHQRSSARTRYAVGTAENGLTIRSSSLPALRTSACASWRRRQAGTTSAWSPTSPGVGARPSSTNRPYVRLRTAMSASSILERYADLIVSVGANVQPGQVVAVEGAPEAAPLVYAIARHAYERGARYVDASYS